jgi:protein Tex
MDIPIQVDLGRIAQDLQIRRVQVESVVQLLDEGNTVPFITRYRKERTGNLNEVVIHEIQLRVQRLRELAERKETILKAIEAQGKLTPDLAIAIRSADNPKRLEDLYLPFKPKKRTKASDARDRGLEPLAFRIWTRDDTLTDLAAAAQELVSAEKGIDSVEKVLEGVGHILAEAISEMATVRDGVRKVVWKTGKIVTTKAELPEGQGLEYRDYFDYSEPAAQIPPHRILAINRGDKEGPLKVRIDVSRPDLEAVLFSQLPLEGHPQGDLFRAAAIDALERLILPSMEREVRRDLTEGAEKHAVEVFAKNLRGLLLQPPIAKQVVLAIDPGFRTGCKLAVLDKSGNLVDQAVIYPHPPQNRRSEAKIALKDLVGKHEVGVVAIGNGTACRETEELVAEIIAEGVQFSSPDYVPPAPIQEPAAESTPEVGSALSPSPDDVPAQTKGPEPDEPASHDHDQAHRPAVDLAPEESPQEPAPTTSENNAAHNHDGAATASVDGTPVGESHSASGTHHSAPTEAPLEMLPPISGGSPDATSPDAEIEVPPGASESSGDTGSTAVLNEDQKEGPGSGPPSSAPAASGIDAGDKESSEPRHDSIVVEAEGHGDSPPVVGETPSAIAEAAAADAAATTPVAQASPVAGETVTPPAARPPRPPKERGQGKSDSSRSRSSRPRHGPPPSQEPPRPHRADAQLAQLAYVVVNEAGASVYSTSQVGRDELPELDATLRSGISIGRRLQDPLAELVKIEPQNIGVGLYQHDVNPKQLKETLESVIASCVNFVGVDLNTASVPLLRHVSGLNQLTARRIVDYRKEHGPFANLDQLTKVEGVGPATFTQAAGFLKIPEGENPLDRTWIHPESYPVAVRLLEKLEFAPEVVRDKVRLPELNEKLAAADLVELSRELEVGEFTLRDILEALGRPERDPREDLPKPIFKKGILKIEDLSAGMELKGTVLNVVDFGAFVDIGLKDSGLVHISQLANRYVKSPHDVVSVGDVVTAWVMGVDQERKRVSLTMVKPGTERQRGQQGAGGRRGPGGPGEPREGDRNRGQGQGRRGGGPGAGGARPPRPAGSALTSPPVGSPSVAVLAEVPGGRRPERDRGGPPSGPGVPRFSDNRGQGPAPPGHGGGPPRQGQGHDSGPQGRGGPRGPYPGQGSGDRFSRQDRGPNPRPPGRPSRPSPPPPPLSKDALAGNVPLRTFGQLKQLWEAKVEPNVELPSGPGDETSQSLPKGDQGSPEAATPAQLGSEASNMGSAPSAETDSQGSAN